MTNIAPNNNKKVQQVLSQVAFFREAWTRQNPKSLFILSCKFLFWSRIMAHYLALQEAFLKFKRRSSITALGMNVALHMDGPPCVSLFIPRC